MNRAQLATMANQIGAFFASMPDHDEALAGIADHLRRFWEPRMRRALLTLLDDPHDDVSGADAPGADAPGAVAPVRHIALVLRDAPRWSRAQRTRYRRALDRLIARLESRSRITLAVQSTGRGNDDAAFYRRLGVARPLPSLRQVLADDPPDFVVSVRLHGALESILAGVPAFHLSYERKGFGAYADLGLDDWVVNAADFDADAVADHLYAPRAALRFWEAATSRADALRVERARLVAALRDAAMPLETAPC